MISLELCISMIVKEYINYGKGLKKMIVKYIAKLMKCGNHTDNE